VFQLLTIPEGRPPAKRKGKTSTATEVEQADYSMPPRELARPRKKKPVGQKIPKLSM